MLCLILNDIVVFLRIEPASPSASQPSLGAGSLQVGLTCSGSANCAAAAAASLSPNSPAITCLISPSAHLSPSSVANDEPGRQEQSHYSIKYYFANIDNKSSVISLGKLLVREKAVNDNEPRIYMISSSPRQPEMYELAFVSKRHQSSFVDKLKASIDQYNRSTDLLDEQLEDCDLEDDLEELAALAACGRASPDEQPLDEHAHAHQNDSDSSTTDCQRPNCLFDSDDELDVGFEDVALEHVQTSKDQPSEQTKPAELLGSSDLKAVSDSEQQSSVPLKDAIATTSSSSSASSSASSASSCCLSAGARDSGNSLLASTNSDNEASSSAGRPAEDSLLTESGLSERAKDSMDEDTSTSRQKLRGARRRRLQRPRNVSNQSSSSEDAHRQALELISCSTTSQSCKQETGNLEPQSALRQADAHKVSVDEEFDSGRGQDDDSSAASTSSNSLETRTIRVEPHSLTNSDVVETTPDSATVCSPSSTGDSTGERSTKERSSLIIKSLSTSSILSSLVANDRPASSAVSGDLINQTQVSPEQHIATSKQPVSSQHNSLVKCPSILSSSKSKACSSFMSKQRKLSTVSTMSSQLKLLNKLRSSGLLGSNQVGQSTFCPQCCYLLPSAGANKSSSSAANDFSNNSDNISQQEQLERQQQQLSTLSKQMRQQIRRSSFVPEQKLEELRDLRIQLDKDKQEWQLKFDRMQEQLLTERRELDLAREKLKLDRQQVANEREQLYRKLDVLKEKGILLSPSHKVIITTPELRLYNPAQVQRHIQADYQHQYQHGQQQPVLKLANQSASRQPVLHQKCIPQPTQLVDLQSSHNMAVNYQTAGNLYMQNSHKVPFHLSQQGLLVNQPAKQSLSLGSYKIPSISSLGGSFLGARNLSKNSDLSHSTRDKKAMSHAV